MTFEPQYASCAKTPGCGIHRWHIFGVAVVDVILTIIVAMLISRLLGVSFYVTVVCLYIIAMIVHGMVGLHPIAALTN